MVEIRVGREVTEEQVVLVEGLIFREEYEAKAGLSCEARHRDGAKALRALLEAYEERGRRLSEMYEIAQIYQDVCKDDEQLRQQLEAAQALPTARALATAEKKLRVQVNEFVDSFARALITSDVTYEETQRAQRYLDALVKLREGEAIRER